MTEAAYQIEKMRGYLLGSLSAEETERLDELSITDAAFADALAAVESDLVDAYVLGELGDERRQFESHYLASPQRRDNVEFARAFQLFGERQEAMLRSAEYDPRRPKKVSWFKSYVGSASVRQWSVLQWGFATAALILLVAGSWLAVQNLRLRREMSAAQARNNELVQREQELQRELEGQRSVAAKISPQPLPGQEEREPDQARREVPDNRQPDSRAIIYLNLTPQLRGAQQKPTIALKPDTKLIAINLALEPDDYSTYQITLLDQGNRQPVWSSRNLRSRTKDDSESLSIRLPASVLKPRAYLLRVTGIAAGASDVIGDYPIQVVKE